MIILQFDNVYHHWGLLLLQSLQLHEPRVAVLCNTANLTEHQVAELKQAHSRLKITNGVSGRATTPAQMAARKPFVMQHAIQNYPDQPWYALLDADFLVRRSLESLWSMLDTHPAALFITNGMDNGKFYPHLVTPSGLVLVRRDASKLVSIWARWYYYDKPICSIAPRAWYWDQITLSKAWAESALPCATIPMDEYGDAQMRPSAAIWSAHVGHLKRWYYEQFREEYQRQKRERDGQVRRD